MLRYFTNFKWVVGIRTQSNLIDNFETHFWKEMSFLLTKESPNGLLYVRLLSCQWHGQKSLPECCLLVTVNDLVVKFSCGDKAEECVVGKCNVTSTSQLSIDNFNAKSTSGRDSSSPSDVSDKKEEKETLRNNLLHIMNEPVIKITR